MTEFDCIIVGGGPAGVSTAFVMSKLGKKVILLDRKNHDQIGNKTCGDALDRQSTIILFNEFGLEKPSGDEVSDEVKYLGVQTEGVKVKFDAPGYTVNRHIYGQRLLKDCERIGVEVIDKAIVREVIIEDNFVKGIRYLKNKTMHEIRGKLVADCSGTMAVIRNRLPDNFSEGMRKKLPDHHIAISFREIMNMKKEHKYKNEVALAYLEDIPPPGYLWFFSKGPKKLNIGTGWLKSENTFDKSMKEIYRDALSKHYSPDEYEVITHGGGQIPIRIPYDSLTFNGGVLVGEAGCMTNPTTAEGHGPALISGYYAGKAMSDAIDKGDVSREGLWKYNIDVMLHYGKLHAISWIGLHFLREIGGKGLEFLLKKEIVKTEELERILDGLEIKVSIIDAIKRVFKVFPKFKLLLSIKKLVDGSGAMTDLYERYPDDPKNLRTWIKERNSKIGEEF